jgi:diguanylate cyclase
LSAAGLAPTPGEPPRRPDDTVAHAHAAIQSMLRLSVRPSPDNFRLWYDYHAGGNPTLRRVVDIYLSTGRAIDDEVMRDLHERFSTPQAEMEALRDAAERLRRIVGVAATAIGEAGADAVARGSTFAALTGELQSTPGALDGVVRRMLAEVGEMCARSAALTRLLQASAEKVHALERELEAAQREATTDPLTGLPNRRALDPRLRVATGEAMDGGQALSLLMLDIDRFKAINDGWGHPVGDAVLRRVAAAVRESLGAEGEAARFGGEEFAVLLPGRAGREAVAVAERLRRAVAAQGYQIKSTGQSVGPVTISVGVAGYQVGETLAAWIERADTALYAAKHGGRNRVVTWEEAEASGQAASRHAALGGETAR